MGDAFDKRGGGGVPAEENGLREREREKGGVCMHVCINDSNVTESYSIVVLQVIEL